MKRKENCEIKLDIELKVINPETGEIKEKRKVKGHTFLANFAKLCVLLFPRGDYIVNQSLKITNGTEYTFSNYTTSSYGYCPITRHGESSSYKMTCIIGTDSTPFSRNNYNVFNQIASVAYSTFSETDDGTQLTISITFGWTNNTGTAKGITELCLASYFPDMTTGGAVRQVALTRDVFSAVNVPNGYVLSISYKIVIPF